MQLSTGGTSHEHLSELREDHLKTLAETVGFRYTRLTDPASLDVVAAAGGFARNLLPRVAARLGVAPVTDVVRIESPDTFVRPIYAGNVLVTVQSLDALKVLTVRATAFAAAPTGGDCPVLPLAAALSEERGTLEDVIEPYLIQQGYLIRTARGRMATSKAYRQIGLKPKTGTGGLFGSDTDAG